jgi:hypothetical protein
LESWVSPTSLEDLEQYSHLWVLFVFHENTNFGGFFACLTQASSLPLNQLLHTMPGTIKGPTKIAPPR